MRQVRERLYPIRDASGQIYRAVGITQDITERVETEQDLKTSERRFNQIVNVLDDVFQISDMETADILFVTPSYEKIWGRSVQDLSAY